MPFSRRALLLFPLAGFARSRVARAADGDAAVTVRGLYDALLTAMKQGKSASFDQRFAQLAPVIERSFDLALMARIAVGPSWTQFTPDQQQRLTAAFIRYTVSQYAGRFNAFDGERFEVEPAPQQTASGLVVQSRLIESNGNPTTLNYLMRQGPGGWRIIDVYLKGTISELATRRSEFTGVLQSQGAEGLVRLLDQRAASLRSG